MFKKLPALVLLAFLGAAEAGAWSHLFFLEIQGVAGYSSARRRTIFYSLSREDVMQKPGLGFDYILRLSGKSRDIGTLAFQARMAYDAEEVGNVQFQLYNASFRYKAGFGDIWAGHSRPALGLSSSLDSHALLLPTLAMTGYGFDRDWGLGMSRDFAWGTTAASLTAGSGMPLRLKGNYLAAARVSIGVLGRDNYSAGLSMAGGKILDIMGYQLMSDDPIDFRCVSSDLTYLWNNLEGRAEVLAGKKDGKNVLALFGRLGMNLFEEGRLKIEAQPVVMKAGRDWRTLLSCGVSLQATADLAFRAMVQHESAGKDTRIVFQVYYYKGI
jgi:hypothetical protein